MKREKGFTLVELLAVIVILGLLAAISVPVYLGITNSMNERMLETKLNELLSKSEKYAEENGRLVFDVKTLIENGYISADNELGEYKNPVTNRDMGCDIINVIYEDGFYKASIKESDVCYELEELENLYGMVEIYLVNKEGTEIEKGGFWRKEEEVKAKYRLRSEYQNLEIESITWSGLENISCSKEELKTERCQEYPVNSNENSIRTVEVHLQAKLKINENEINSHASTRILLDNQRPIVLEGSINVNNEVNTSGKRRVEFEISDGGGSGIEGYSIVDSIKTNTCQSVSYTESSEGVQVEYLKDAKTYYICVKDKVGNVSSDDDLANERNQIRVENIDTSKPIISTFSVASRDSYNGIRTKVTIKASDSENNTEGLRMCISYTNYLTDCTWENYAESKDIDLPSNTVLNGSVKTFYVSIQDQSGNTVSRSANYVLYKECGSAANQRKSYTQTDFGACNKSCGGGLQYKNYEMKDIYTSKTCSTGSDSRACNTQSCDPVESMDPNNYESSKKVACDATLFKRLLDNYINKFKTALDYQPFRNAIYDCASTTESIISRNYSAINILSNHSRTTVGSGKGRLSRVCKEKCPSNCERDCSTSSCIYVEDYYKSAISSPIYSGKALVISVATSGKPCSGSNCNLRHCTDDYSDCSCDIGGDCRSNEWYHYGTIFVGDSNTYGTAVWRYAPYNEMIKADSSTMIKFLNNFGATAVYYYENYFYDTCQYEFRVTYRTYPVYVKYFKI